MKEFRECGKRNQHLISLTPLNWSFKITAKNKHINNIYSVKEWLKTVEDIVKKHLSNTTGVTI